MPAAQGQEGRPHRGMPERQTNREGARSCRHLPDSRQYASVKRRNHEPTAGAVGIGITEAGRAGLGAVVTGLGLESPAPEVRETLRRAFRASPMLCIRGCKATPESFLRLARAFGTPQHELLGVLRDPAFPEISLVERRQGISTATGKPATFGGHWHTDDSYMAVPCAATLLYGEVVPPNGGDTSFTNMHAAYDALPELKRVNPKLPTGRRRTTHHQWFTPDLGHPRLKEHLAAVMALMRAAPNWDRFTAMLNRALPKQNDERTK